MRELMASHREKPMCASCHVRMDPLGLALENFNAMGGWREFEVLPPKPRERTLVTGNARRPPTPEELTPVYGARIDASAELVGGRKFDGIEQLKRILIEDHRIDFYRCLTEKVFTYALGRAPEAADTETIDIIVERLEREGGKFSALLYGLVESAPFQKRRNSDDHSLAQSSPPAASSSPSHP